MYEKIVFLCLLSIFTMYNFDEIIDRRSTRCCKVNTLKQNYEREDLNQLKADSEAI